MAIRPALPRNQAVALQRRWMDSVEKAFDNLNHKIDDREEKFDRQLDGLEKVLAAVSTAMRDLTNAVDAQKPIAAGHQELRTIVIRQGDKIDELVAFRTDSDKRLSAIERRFLQGEGALMLAKWAKGAILAVAMVAATAFGYVVRHRQDIP